MINIPQNLDWVTVRSSCSIEKVFRELHDGVQEDVRIVNALPPMKERTPLQLATHKAGHVFLVRRGESVTPIVKFIRERDEIRIEDEVSGQTFNVTLTINDEGRCKLKIAGEELEQWQVRRRALEGLLFNT